MAYVVFFTFGFMCDIIENRVTKCLYYIYNKSLLVEMNILTYHMAYVVFFTFWFMCDILKIE